MSTTALTLEDIAIALKPTGLPDIIMYQYYKNLEQLLLMNRLRPILLNQ